MPYLAYFSKIARSDLFVVLDTVQFGRKSWENRCHIKTAQGPLLLTVPVEHGSDRIVKSNWARKHVRSIELAYQNAPYFDAFFPTLWAIFQTEYERLADLNLVLLYFGLWAFGIKTPVVKASDYDFRGAKSDLVLDMCKQLKAKKYIFGAMGRNYADIEAFTRAGIELEFQDYQHPVYHQLHGEFLPRMSFIDYLFNGGIWDS